MVIYVNSIDNIQHLLMEIRSDISIIHVKDEKGGESSPKFPRMKKV